MAEVKDRVGFVGLGVMGKPMARNLIAAGFELVVWSRTRASVDEVSGDGATAAGSAREVAEQADVTILMLPDSPQVREVLDGDDGLLAGAREGSLVIDMSTISPVVTREIAEECGARGIGWVDAPVSGGDVGARDATLSIMAGGAESDFARARPLFEALGRTIVHVGPVGSGQVVKACNQVVVALTIEAVSEALVLGSKAGVDPATIIEVLSGGMAANRVMEVRGRNFLEHDFTPGFRIDLHHKDLGIALQTAREHGVALPNTAAVDQMLQALRSAGRGDRDHSALLTHVEDLAQHTIGAPAGATA
ncbi:MAG TPA: 2-hydroxy-3-oxopropionate reductase [Solirubrobacteraceae bacterium]|nr:2-hydroxy-3-oxopropionate reductase [Solirubrobacteraceae bacterium]